MSDIYNPSGSSGGVASVNAQTGVVTIQSAGLTIAVTNPSSGVINLEASGGSSVAFTALTSGTNTTASMVVGSGATLAATGSGTITATAVPAAGITGTTLASNVVTSSLTTVGTIGTGVWQGSLIGATYGGTGVNNGASTITLGGSLTTSGANALTLTTTGSTNVTLPTSGTLLANALTSADIFVGNASNVATGVAVSGDLTLLNTGAFTVAKIAGVTVGTPTGTGNVVFSASPTFTGTIIGANANYSGSVTAGVSALTIATGAFPTNAALANTFTLTLVNGATTATNPTNPTNGQCIRYFFVQPASGSAGTISWGGAFDFGTAGAPTLTVTNGKMDIVGFEYSSINSKWNYLGNSLGF